MKRKFILLPITLTALAPVISLVGCDKNKPEDHNYANDYLTFTAIDGGFFQCDIERRAKSKDINLDLWYSINDGEWKKVKHNYVDEKVFEHKYYYQVDDVVRLKGENEYFSHVSDDDNETWRTSLHFTGLGDISGNVMSLLYGDNFKGKTDLKCDGVFMCLFQAENYSIVFPQIVNASNLILPATNLRKYCYDVLFGECVALLTPPKLPATNLAEYCYELIFRCCSSLQSAPYLPATTLIDGCYSGMFSECQQLKIEEEGNDNQIIFTCPENIPQYAVYSMFSDTGGTVTIDPLPLHTYYWGK